MKLTTAILILAGLAGATLGDTAEVDDVYFHPAASLYIHGDSAGASNLVEKGLSVYPDDAKLQRLKDLLKQQQQQNDQQQDQNKQDKQDKQDQQQDQNKQDQQQQDQNKQDQQQQDQNKQDKQDQQQDQEQQDQNEQQNSDQEQQAETEPRPAEEMTPEEARQLFDAMKQEEKNERLQLHPVYGAPVRVDKDW